MEYFRIKQNRNVLRFLLKGFFQNISVVFFAFFVIISILIIFADLSGNKVIAQIKHGIQFKFLDYAKNFMWITNPINKTVVYWNKNNNMQYKDFLGSSYLENADFRRIINENKRLKNLLKYLDINNLQNMNYVTTKIISNIDSTYGFIQLGKKNGIKNNQIVLNELGLVGKVVDVTESQAKIIFVTDSNCRVLSMTAESNHKIIVSGNNGKYLNILYLADGAKLKTGEIVVTTADFNFPADIKIGIINSNSKVEPVVDLNDIDFVTIITG